MAIKRWGGGPGPERLPPLAPEALSEAQKAAEAEFKRARGVPLSGPFWPLIRSPEMMLRAHQMGQYLRYNSHLPNSLSEMAILLTAREWNQPYEWEAHRPPAVRAGLPEAIINAIAEGRRPAPMSEDQTVVYEVLEQLWRTKQVDDALYARATKALGEAGLIDLIGICGYYGLLAMTLNVARSRTDGLDIPPLAGT